MSYILRKNRNSQIPIKGPPGVGYKLDKDGNYDISDKKLVNIKNPDDDNDAVNLQYFNDNAIKYAKKHNYINLRKKHRFTNTGFIPLDEEDTLIPKRLALCLNSDDKDAIDRYFDAKHFPIKNIPGKAHFIFLPGTTDKFNVLSQNGNFITIKDNTKFIINKQS